MAEQQTWQWSTRVGVQAVESESVLYGALKRGMDIVLSALLIVFLFPLLLLIALLIKLDSRGPVIFSQERVGAKRQRMGRHRVCVERNFTFYKFRSMVQNADPSLHQAYIKDFVEGRVQPGERAHANAPARARARQEISAGARDRRCGPVSAGDRRAISPAWWCPRRRDLRRR